MNNQTKNIIIFSCIFIILLIFVLILIKIFNCTRKLPDNTSLIKNNKFYSEKYEDTVKYLSAVYPTCKNVFNKMSHIDLAIFYNSLWFYYNCESSFNQMLGKNGPYSFKNERVCWQSLPQCGTKYPKLPYTPQGYLYSYQSWTNNNFKPWIYSDSSIHPKDLISFAPGGPIWYWNVGPAPMFSPQRAIQRMVYNTKLPSKKQYKDGNGKIRIYSQPSILPGFTNKWKSYWNYPKEWYKGIPNNGFIEVLGSAEPGMPISGAAVWLNGIPGSGVFYNVGKSKIARNKVDITFLLTKELCNTKEGIDILQKNYGTSDPYQLINLLIKGGPNKIDPLIWDPNKKETINCSWNGGAGNINISVPYNSDGWHTLSTIKAIDQDTWCSDKKLETCIDNIRTGKTYQAERIAAQGPFDEALTWMGLYLGYDSLQLTQSANGTGFWQFEIVHLRDLPENVKQRNFSDYIELVDKCKPGSWSNVKWRETNFMINYMKKLYNYFTLRNPLDIYNEKYVSKCLVPNPWSLINLKSGPDTPENQFNITCSNNISNMYTNLAVFGDGKHLNQCYPSGIGYKYKPMTDPNYPPFS